MMADSFKNMGDLEKQIKDDLNKIFRGTAIQAFNEIVLESPVDTGRFRSNWQASVNSPNNNILLGDQPTRKDKKGKPIKNQFNRGFDASHVGNGGNLEDVLYLTNNLPYAARLASGYSDQRSDGWIDRIILTSKQGLAANIRKLKDSK